VRGLIDERMDELAASAHQAASGRVPITAGVGYIAHFMIGWTAAAIWTGFLLSCEIWAWFATRPQFLGKPISFGQRLNHLINISTETTGWVVMGWMLWRTGTPQGAICGVVIWLAIISFAQSFAYQTPLGFVVAGVLPALAMLGLTLIPTPLKGASIALIWPTLLLAVVFIVGGANQTIAARRRYREVQHQLRRSEALYRLLANNSSDVIALSGVDGTRRYISPSIEQALGYSVETLLNAPNYTYLYPEDRPLVVEAIASLNPENPQRTIEYRVIRKDGGVTWAETCFTLAPGAGPNGSDEVVSVSREVTTRKAMEAELVEARRRAEAAAAAKAEFLANMTHELRTPLNAIIGFSGLLKASSELAEQDARYAAVINDASENLLDLVNGVLDLSKIDAGAVELELKPFDPSALAEGAAAMISAQAEAKGLVLSVRCDGESAALAGDAARIRQVLLNLLSNALKFTCEGEVAVRTRVSGDGHTRQLRIEVRDTGVGVPSDRQDLVFDRFAQADASVSRRFGGTGLGLAISKRLIELMGGRIGVVSVEGQGSTFWFEITLPLADDATAAADGETGPSGPDRPLKLLLVEDVAVNRELILALLRPFEIEIDCAADGVEAIAAVRRTAYDLILMDVQMPVMDGLTATRRIRAENLTDAPIIAMTANVLPDQIERCLEAGMSDHLGKPISPARMLEVIGRWTAEAEASAPTSAAESL
jgi:PAS domain S-box-containing protein